MRSNGLFGWVSENDKRSMQLFGGFVVALHLLALPTLFIPVAIFDPAHAPFIAWEGYAVRYVPILTLLAAAMFAGLTWWNLSAIKRRLPLKPVSRRSEPRLCRIAEPLLIASGIGNPKLAVIESPALNAFAYGLGAGSATLVVTRGLVDGLDDEELAAVLAHEITHIRNGDVRFMAAANAFLGCIGLLDRANTVGVGDQEHKTLFQMYGILWFVIVPPAVLLLMFRGQPRDDQAIRAASLEVRDATAWIIGIMFLPFTLLPLLFLLFVRQQALNLGGLVRFLISSSREFIADAGAVELTRNPAALVSALKRIEGRSVIGDAPAEYHAMMIDGASAGSEATHPGIAERIAAIVRNTGSMALIAPSRRDTRPGQVRGFGRRSAGTDTELETSPATAQTSALTHWRRIATRDFGALAGLNGPQLFGIVIGIAAMVGFNAHLITKPAALVGQFDPKPAAALGTIARVTFACATGLAAVMDPSQCEEASIARELAPYAKGDNAIASLARTMAKTAQENGG